VGTVSESDDGTVEVWWSGGEVEKKIITVNRVESCYDVSMQTGVDYNRKWAERDYKLPKWVRVLMLPVTYPHEMAHYLVGRLLGMEIKRHELHASYIPSDQMWKDVLMLMAPTVLAVLIMLGAFQLIDFSQTAADYLLIYGFAMFVSSGADWYSVAKRMAGRFVQRPAKSEADSF